ncbi:MAG: hypothetical protein FWG66_15105 [Spirochaetes bacterium]|nr:hypothetical protein [Spirochaetota bacterium]
MTQALDLSKNWIIYANLLERQAAEELALCISCLRKNAGAKALSPPIYELQGTEHSVLHNSMPVIVMKAAAESPDKNGFSWNFSGDKIKISGDSPRGLWNGLFDFLSALGFKWPAAGQEELPQAADSSGSDSLFYALSKASENCPSSFSMQEDAGERARLRRRLFIDKKMGRGEKEELVKWAARNKYDALVFSMAEKSFWASSGTMYGAKKFAFVIEAGGKDLPLLLPRVLFVLSPGMFRMEKGRRTPRYNFCPTNPKTISAVMKKCRDLFNSVAGSLSAPKVFHLLPSIGSEYMWCNCPACRAFSPNEQYIIAVKTAAAELFEIDPAAQLSFFDFASKDSAESNSIPPQENMFLLN